VSNFVAHFISQPVKHVAMEFCTDRLHRSLLKTFSGLFYKFVCTSVQLYCTQQHDDW